MGEHQAEARGHLVLADLGEPQDPVRGMPRPDLLGRRRSTVGGTGRCRPVTKGVATVLRNPDHVTIAVADVAPAIEFFELLGF